MMQVDFLRFDDNARALIARRLKRRPTAALRLDLAAVYAPRYPSVRLDLRWTTAERARRDAGLLTANGPCGVPVFIAPRLWRYLFWHPITVIGQRIGPFTRLLPGADALFVDDLRRWEQQHPNTTLPDRVA